VARLMREAGLCAKGKRQRVVTTCRDASHSVAPNLLHRDFTATEPNKKWATDITSIPTAQGWLYLAVILDVYSRAVVGWSMSASCDEELVAKAFHMALVRRRPKAGLLHHSDRGCQYTSRAYRQRLEQAGMVVSMSRKGNCWDNAAMESFFGSRHARSAWGVRSIRPMSKPGSHSLSTWRSTTIARGVIQRSDT
jgi:transposase InsO family protein